MIAWLDEIDRTVFLFLNGLNSSFWDPIIYRLTEQLYWFPFFAIVLYLIIKNYRKRSILILLGIALTIVLADQFTFRLMKPFFARPRPTHQPELEGLVHFVNNYKGGLYGFASSHAANSFGVATFLLLAVKDKIPWIWVMFIWAAIFSYTRIYLGVHYPGDIIVGGLVGAVMGYFAYLLERKEAEKLSL